MTDVRKSGQWCSTIARDADPGLCEQHYASTFTSTARQQRQRCVHNGAKCVLETPTRLYQCPIKDSLFSSSPASRPRPPPAPSPLRPRAV
eukprot:2818870-Pleurochrysis_carterae.AAC.1